LNPSPSIDISIPQIRQGMEEMSKETTTLCFKNVLKCADPNEIKMKFENGTMEYEENEEQKVLENSLENELKIIADDRQSSCSSTKSSPISPSSNSRPEKRKWEKPEHCLICGQSAQCFNFGAHCCHGKN
jgi:hypothetical protein